MFKVCVASQVEVDLEISAVPVDPGQAASKEGTVLMPCCTFHCLLSGSYVYITKVVKLRSRWIVHIPVQPALAAAASRELTNKPL